MYEKIDLLQESENYYFLDFIPYTTDDPEFLILEDYFERTYLSSFAEKVVRIILKIIYYCPCEVYLTDPTGTTCPDDMKVAFNTNIRNDSPDDLAKIIRQVILTDFSSLQILFSSPEFLISVCGEFSVTIYGAEGKEEVIHLLQQLAAQEGLFLKQNVEANR